MLKIKQLPNGEIAEVESLKVSFFENEKIFYYKDQKTDLIICSDYETGTRLLITQYKTLERAEKEAIYFLSKRKDQYLQLKDKIRNGDGGHYKLKIINN